MNGQFVGVLIHTDCLVGYTAHIVWGFSVLTIAEFSLVKHHSLFFLAGLESKLRELCDEFLGPVFKSKNTTWEPKILVGLCLFSLSRGVH